MKILKYRLGALALIPLLFILVIVAFLMRSFSFRAAESIIGCVLYMNEWSVKYGWAPPGRPVMKHNLKMNARDKACTALGVPWGRITSGELNRFYSPAKLRELGYDIPFCSCGACESMGIADLADAHKQGA